MLQKADVVRVACVPLLLGASLVLTSTPAHAAQGNVVLASPSCHDHYVVATKMGFAILEWMGGATPNEKDFMAGDFESYGTHKIQDVTQDAESSAWVEDYYLSQSSTVEKIKKFCS